MPVIEDEEVVPMEVISVVRGKAEIPCDVTAGTDDTVQLVLWYKDGSTLPIYSYDARGKPTVIAKHWSDENHLGRRAFFRLFTTPATLLVDNVAAEDSGIYRCRVDFRKSKTKTTEINLSVIVPPQMPKIFDELGREVSDRIGPYEERQPLRLTCYSSDGKPEPRVEWFQNGRLIDGVSEVRTVLGVIQNVLVIPSLQRKDFGSLLSCEASNTNLTLPPRRTVVLDLYLRTLTTRILSSRQPLIAGKRYDIACQAAGSRPPAVITWWKNGELLKNAKETIHDDGNVTMSQLTFVPTVNDDGKALQCHAENVAMSNSGLKDSWMIEVLYRPEVIASFGKNLDPTDIKEGEDVYFECRVNSKPKPFRLGWRKEGSTLAQNISSGIIVSERTLVLQRVSSQSSGFYSCYAVNTEGEGVSDQVRLRIKHRPVCHPQQQFEYGAFKGSTTQISCSVDAYPAARSFRWVFNSTDDQINLNEYATRSKSGVTSVLRYVPKTDDDFGVLLCYAVNEMGSQREPCVFHVYPAGPPESPKNCSLINEKSTSVGIECQEPFGEGLEQHYVLEIFDPETRRSLANLTSSQPRFEVLLSPTQTVSPSSDDGFVSESRITPSTAVLHNGVAIMKITAVNGQGHSDPVYLETLSFNGMAVEMQTSATSAMPFEFTTTVGALIGLCGTAFILVVVLVVAAMTHITKKPASQKTSTNDLNTEEGIELNLMRDKLETNSLGESDANITDNPFSAFTLLPLTPAEVRGKTGEHRCCSTLPRSLRRNSPRKTPVRSASFSSRHPKREILYAYTELQVQRPIVSTIMDPSGTNTSDCVLVNPSVSPLSWTYGESGS